MVVKEAKVPEWASVWGMPKDVLGKISEQIDYFQNATSKLGTQVRVIAQETIDLLLFAPVPNDIDEQKRDIIERYSSILLQFSSTTHDPDLTLNQMWTDMEQSISFYLLDAGQNDDTDPTEIRELINELDPAAQEDSQPSCRDLKFVRCYQGKRWSVAGSRIAIAESTNVLVRTKSELDMGAAIMTRLIGMAEHQHKLLTGK